MRQFGHVYVPCTFIVNVNAPHRPYRNTLNALHHMKRS